MNRTKNALYRYRILIGLLTIALPFLLLGAPRVKAQNHSPFSNPAALFYQAGNSYEKGDYQTAAQLYNTLIKKGYESGPLYFNLANTYYKLGRKGEAILFYEKAKQLMPGDADLRSNLEFALRSVDEGHPGWQRDFYESLVSLSSLENLMILSSSLFFIVALFLSLILLFPMGFQEQTSGKLKSWCLTTLIGIATLFVFSLSLTIITGLDHQNQKAVAVRSGGEVKFEPNLQSTTYYPLSEGSRVRILEEKQGWKLIQRRDGKLGWIENKFLAGI